MQLRQKGLRFSEFPEKTQEITKGLQTIAPTAWFEKVPKAEHTFGRSCLF
jgi:hypothetical protein